MTRYRFVGATTYIAVGYHVLYAGPDGCVRGLEGYPELAKYLLERSLIVPVTKSRKEEVTDANLSTIESGAGN